MYDSIGLGGSEQCYMPTAKQVVESPSILDNMKRQKSMFEERLNSVNECIEALEANPEITRVLELINKTRY